MLLGLEKNLSVLSDVHRRRECSSLIRFVTSRSQMRANRVRVETGLSFEAVEGSTLEDVSTVLKGNNLAFFTHTLCPYAERTWITLLEKVGALLRN